MAKNKRALIVCADSTRRQVWIEYLEALDWQVRCVDDVSGVEALIEEFLPVLLLLGFREGEHPADFDEDFAQRFRDSGLAVIPVLIRPGPEDVAASFRRGAIDVLIEPVTAADLEAAIERSGSFKNLYQENMDYRVQLERANRELRDSLNTLRMDQLAGRQVQFSILPRQPIRCSGYEVAHTIVPSLYLSGDFVGYNVVFDRYILFYFGDVSGHGASSAFVTVMLSFLLRQIRRRHVVERDMDALARAPEGLAEHMNKQMLAMDIDKHLTFFAGAIDVEKNTLRYTVSALMPQPMLAVAGAAQFLPGRGQPLGLVEEGQWVVEEIDLPEKSALIVASDGLLDGISGADLAEKENQLLAMAGEATGGENISHTEVCAAFGIDAIKDAPDDVSILTVTRRT